MTFSGNFMPRRFGAGRETVRHGSSALTSEQSDQTKERTGERYLHIQHHPMQASRGERRRRQYRPKADR